MCIRDRAIDVRSIEAFLESLSAEFIVEMCIRDSLTAKNTIVTPHVAFATKEALIKRAVIVFQNIVKYLDGTPQNEVCAR